MNKKIVYGSILLLILLGLWIGFYYRASVLSLYNGLTDNAKQFQQTDLGDIVDQVKKEIFTPPPLNIGGRQNQAVLTKAKVIAETNIQRYNHGLLPPLIENAKLNAASKDKAEDMFKNQYFEHVSPPGLDPGTLVKNSGYEYIVSGENLILGNFANEEEMVQNWMDSPGHRANILNNRFTDIGVAVVKGVYQGETAWIGVQEFGLPLSTCPSPSDAIKTEIEKSKIMLNQLLAQIEAKQAEIENTNQRSPRYAALVEEYNSLVGQYNQLAQTIKNMANQYNAEVNNFNQCVEGH